MRDLATNVGPGQAVMVGPVPLDILNPVATSPERQRRQGDAATSPGAPAHVMVRAREGRAPTSVRSDGHPSRERGEDRADVDELLGRLVRGVVEGADEGVPFAMRLCPTAVSVLDADGAAITLAYTRLERVTLCATDAMSRRLGEVQNVLAKGPGPEADRAGTYTRPDVDGADSTSDPRWPMLESSTVTELRPLSLHAIPFGGGSEHAEVHQATGMVVAQMDMDAQDATALLRAHAYAQDRSLSDVAVEVLDQRLAFSGSQEKEIEANR